MELMFQPLKKYADFQGRARRKEYWLFTLFLIGVEVAFALLTYFLDGGPGDPLSLVIALLFVIFCVGMFVPSLAVTFRRLHDTNRSALWLLIAFIPIIGGITLLVFTLFDGTKGPNRFGPDPKGQDAEVFA